MSFGPGGIALDYGQNSAAFYNGPTFAANYATMRSLVNLVSSTVQLVYITGIYGGTMPDPKAGMFIADRNDITSADNGGTIIVGATGVRWKRLFDGEIHAKWFTGVVADGGNDDTAGLNAALLAATRKTLYFANGTYLVSSALQAYTNTKLEGETREGVIIQRTATHVGHTLILGQDIPGAHAGSCDVKNIWFNRSITFNGGAQYNPGVSTLIDNKLVGGQAHIYANEVQHSEISNCYFVNMPYHVVYSGGSLGTLQGNIFSGSIWDQLTVGLQEGIAQVWYKKTVGGNHPTVMFQQNNDFSGGYGSAARNVNIGIFVANYSENVGPKFGLQIDTVEGLDIKGDYFGGHNAYSIYASPINADIVSNVKITAGCFFDGARLECIHFGHGDINSSAVFVTITDNVFNGELACQRAIGFGKDGFAGVPAAYSVKIANNTMMGFTFSPIYIDSVIGGEINDNIVSAYNCRTGNAGDPAGAAGCYVIGAAGVCDKIKMADNVWGGGTNNLSGVNNCQYGVYFGGTFATYAIASGDQNNGLGLVGGALVTGGDSSVHFIGTAGQPAFTNAWANFGGGFNNAGFWKDADGTVYLQGMISAGALTTAAFTLPVGYRPAGNLDKSTAANGAFGFMVISTTGTVVPQVGSNVWFSLEGVFFKAA